VSASLEIAREGHIATVAFNRPQALNACTTAMLEEIVDAFSALEDDAEVRCVILRGNGRAFCVGADIKERASMSVEDVRRRRRIAPLAFGAMRRFSRPVIARVHGHAIGGGLEMALGCDIVVAAEDTRMSLPETAKASIPAGGGTQILPRLVGVARAKELIFTSRAFTARDAARWGMIGHAVPEAELDATVAGLAAEIAAVSPISNMQAKRAIDLGLHMDLASGVQVEAALYERMFSSEDRLEAEAAGREGRRPVYAGR
jgi:enoyl-CoA hydratase/carnithine racemase